MNYFKGFLACPLLSIFIIDLTVDTVINFIHKKGHKKAMERQPNETELLGASQNIAKIERINNHSGKSSIYKQASGTAPEKIGK